MKKITAFLLVVCLSISLCSCGAGKKLTKDNYEQYLSVGASVSTGDTPHITCFCTPETENYDFNDVVITIRVTGTYKLHNKIWTGYSSPGVPHYDCTIPHSSGSFDETFELKLTVGGTIAQNSISRKAIELPEGDWIGNIKGTTTINSGNVTWNYEILSVTGTVSK